MSSSSMSHFKETLTKRLHKTLTKQINGAALNYYVMVPAQANVAGNMARTTYLSVFKQELDREIEICGASG